MNVLIWLLLNIEISQESVATPLRYDEIFKDDFIANFICARILKIG